LQLTWLTKLELTIPADRSRISCAGPPSLPARPWSLFGLPAIMNVLIKSSLTTPSTSPASASGFGDLRTMVTTVINTVLAGPGA
jgi:hypothetical protein